MSVDEAGNNMMMLAIKHKAYDSAIELCEDYSLFQLITENNKVIHQSSANSLHIHSSKLTKAGENCVSLSIREEAYSLAKYFIKHAKHLDSIDNVMI